MILVFEDEELRAGSLHFIGTRGRNISKVEGKAS